MLMLHLYQHKIVRLTSQCYATSVLDAMYFLPGLPLPARDLSVDSEHLEGGAFPISAIARLQGVRPPQ